MFCRHYQKDHVHRAHQTPVFKELLYYPVFQGMKGDNRILFLLHLILPTFVQALLLTHQIHRSPLFLTPEIPARNIYSDFLFTIACTAFLKSLIVLKGVVFLASTIDFASVFELVTSPNFSNNLCKLLFGVSIQNSLRR